MNKIFISFFVLLIFISAAMPQDDWKFSGQLQLRSEVDGRDFSNRTHALTFTSMRTRVAVEKTFMDKVNFFVQFQDSRVFGEEQATLNAIDNIDLHQGYVLLKNPFDLELDVQAGRFEVAYGTERFLGAVGWHYIGRSWDGVRFSLKTDFKFDLFALTHSESNGYIANAVPAIYPYPSISETSQSIYGVWTTFQLNTLNRFDLFGYYNKRRNINQVAENDINQMTAGINHVGSYGAFSTVTEAAYQFGDVLDFDLSAYLFSLQGFYSTGCLKLGLGMDILSGTEIDSDDLNTFYVDFGTNHKFYGYMDYFINIPVNTRGSGLNDFYITASLQSAESKWSGSINLHQLMSNKERTIFRTTGGDVENANPPLSSSYGQEIDLTLKYDFVKGTSLTWGGSMFIQGDIMKDYFSPEGFFRDEDPAFWTYIMLTASL